MLRFPRRSLAFASALTTAVVFAQEPSQPKVTPGPNEPDWDLVLREQYGLSMFGDLLNPAKKDLEEVRGLFQKAGEGPVVFRPVIALGLETRNRGGWYRPSVDGSLKKTETWTYIFKNTTSDLETGANLPPRLEPGAKLEFEPGDGPFGLWISNDGLNDGGVFSEPKAVAKLNKRLAAQPYKAMIYPNRNRTTGEIVPNSYIVGWEYSTNDDFQDVVCQVDNVVLLKSDSN